MAVALPEPPKPVKGVPVLSWAFSLWEWLKRNGRIYAGKGLRETQTEQGRILSVLPPDPMIGQVIMMAGAMVGPTADRWLLCDGASVAVADYPLLHQSIGYTWGGGGANFNLPPAGVFPVFSGQSPGFVNDAIEYALGDMGGFNLHGLAENNHPDHSFTVDLDHTHDVPMDSQSICDGPPDGGGCLYGAKTVPDYTAVITTGDPDDWGTDDFVPVDGPNDSAQGSASKTDNLLNVTLKHGGWTDLATNSGDFADNVDNRPRFAAFNAYIRALP